MLDINRLRRIHLKRTPNMQRIVSTLFLTPNYRLGRRVQIHLEGLENLPDQPVIFAMNHTDRYNYWPFQYQLAKQTRRYTATWVKGKYFENPAIAWFLEHTNNLPVVSKGYIITRDFLQVMGRAPNEEEYRFLRDKVEQAYIDASTDSSEHSEGLEHSLQFLPSTILSKPRCILGYDFDSARLSYGAMIQHIYMSMMKKFAALHKQALADHIDILIFPEGTRSKSLQEAHTGLAHIALYTKAPVLPIGCSGSDRLYPGNSPWARKGSVHYRIGQPIDSKRFLKEQGIHEFEPFSMEADRQYHPQFIIFVNECMDSINKLVDPPYKRKLQGEAENTQEIQRNTKRFI